MDCLLPEDQISINHKRMRTQPREREWHLIGGFDIREDKRVSLSLPRCPFSPSESVSQSDLRRIHLHKNSKERERCSISRYPSFLPFSWRRRNRSDTSYLPSARSLGGGISRIGYDGRRRRAHNDLRRNERRAQIQSVGISGGWALHCETVKAKSFSSLPRNVVVVFDAAPLGRRRRQRRRQRPQVGRGAAGLDGEQGLRDGPPPAGSLPEERIGAQAAPAWSPGAPLSCFSSLLTCLGSFEITFG